MNFDFKTMVGIVVSTVIFTLGIGQFLWGMDNRIKSLEDSRSAIWLAVGHLNK